jgi:acyl-coenzyme A synthetase/AMP-(fatty) acid ligase
MLSIPAQSDVERRLGVPIHVYYGLTETGGICSLAPPGTARIADGDIGIPADAHFRLVDSSDRAINQDNRTGQLQIYSANLMKEYFGDADATREKFDNGWLRTGDLAQRVGQTFVLQGRIDEMFKTRHGIAVYPAPLEQLLSSREDVAEAVVIGVNLQRGPRIEAWVIANGSVGGQWGEEVHGWLHARLGPQFTPDRLHVVDSLPRVTNGKVQRSVLRAQLLDQNDSIV